MLLQISINEKKTIQELAEAALKQVLDDTTADGEFIMYIECHACEARGSVKHFPKVQVANIKSTWNDRADSFLDEYIFRGGTLREWVEKIERGEIRAERHGRWVERSGNYGFTFYCSRCGEVAHLDKFEERILSDFCPSCGAKMDGGTDDEQI